MNAGACHAQEGNAPREVARFNYTDRDGNLLYYKIRFEPGDDGRKKSFKFFHGEGLPGRGGEPGLYNLPNVLPAGAVFLPEGCAKADLLNKWGFCATALDSGASSKLTDMMVEQLSGKKIIILTDNDEPGRRFGDNMAQALVGHCSEVRVVNLPGLKEKEDVIDWAKIPGNDWARLAQIVAKAAPYQGEKGGIEWPELVPLNGCTAPVIPEDLLPGWAGEYAREVARSIQVPYSLALAAVLGTASLAACSCVKCLHVGPGHDEPLNIYLLAPLDSGERKTGTVGAATSPIFEWESEQYEIKKPEIISARSKRKTQEKIIEARRNKAGRIADDSERQALIDDIALQESSLEEVPHFPRILADDVTPEKLAILLHDQKEVIGIITSEGGIFDIFGGRYSKDGIPNLDLFLKAHSAEPYRVDRMGRDPISLNAPHLIACVCPQPEVLYSMVDKPGFRGRGVIARFLYFFSDSRVGYRDVSPAPIPNGVSNEYSLSIKSMLDMRGANLELSLSPGARAAWLSFAQAVEEEMRPGREFERFRDWAGKLPGQAARIAGIFHCISSRLPGEMVVSEDTMTRALDLAAILADHARIAFSVMGSDPATEAAKSILKWIERKEQTKFTLRDCFRDLAGQFKGTSDIKPALAVLIERGYIMDIGMEETGKKGRPKGPYYIVNPIMGGDA